MESARDFPDLLWRQTITHAHFIEQSGNPLRQLVLLRRLNNELFPVGFQPHEVSAGLRLINGDAHYEHRHDSDDVSLSHFVSLLHKLVKQLHCTQNVQCSWLTKF
jgi:hypothetical protein